jgi:hypothetical protein
MTGLKKASGESEEGGGIESAVATLAEGKPLEAAQGLLKKVTTSALIPVLGPAAPAITDIAGKISKFAIGRLFGVK